MSLVAYGASDDSDSNDDCSHSDDNNEVVKIKDPIQKSSSQPGSSNSTKAVVDTNEVSSSPPTGYISDEDDYENVSSTSVTTNISVFGSKRKAANHVDENEIPDTDKNSALQSLNGN